MFRLLWRFDWIYYCIKMSKFAFIKLAQRFLDKVGCISVTHLIYLVNWNTSHLNEMRCETFSFKAGPLLWCSSCRRMAGQPSPPLPRSERLPRIPSSRPRTEIHIYLLVTLSSGSLSRGEYYSVSWYEICGFWTENGRNYHIFSFQHTFFTCRAC